MNNPLPERAAQPRMKVRVPNASSKKNDVIIKIKHCHVVWLLYDREISNKKRSIKKF